MNPIPPTDFPTPESAPGNPPPRKKGAGLVVIGVLKLLQATLLLVVSFGVLHMLHRDVRHVVEQIVNLIRVDPENRYVAALLAKLGLVDDRHLKELVGLAAIYSALFFTEGTGLVLRKRWAEYLTVIATGSLIPLEVYEIFRHCTLSRILLFVGNLLIVIYLIVQLRRERHCE